MSKNSEGSKNTHGKKLSVKEAEVSNASATTTTETPTTTTATEETTTKGSLVSSLKQRIQERKLKEAQAK